MNLIVYACTHISARLAMKLDASESPPQGRLRCGDALMGACPRPLREKVLLHRLQLGVVPWLYRLASWSALNPRPSSSDPLSLSQRNPTSNQRMCYQATRASPPTVAAKRALPSTIGQRRARVLLRLAPRRSLSPTSSPPADQSLTMTRKCSSTARRYSHSPSASPKTLRPRSW